MIVTIEEDIYGNLILPLPPELTDIWEIGDTIKWLVHEDSTVLLVNESWEVRQSLQP